MHNRILLFICFIITFQVGFSQTEVKHGDISGLWTKTGSPYIVKGDINIPNGKQLEIEAGCEIRIQSGCKINVQGGLIAEGTNTDSIIFTLDDSLYTTNNGWHGIRFDARPVTIDTVSIKTPKNEKFRQHFMEQVQNGDIDTTTHYVIRLLNPDVLNDTLLPDALFQDTLKSVLSYCKISHAKANNRPKPYLYGGAVYIYRYSNLNINNCTFYDNSAIAGGAVYCKEAAPVMFKNTFTNNHSQSSAGAVAFIYSGAIFVDNVLINNSSGYNGGAILFHESCPYFTSNTLLNNSAKRNGGAIIFENKQRRFLKDGNPVLDEKPYFKKLIQVDSLKIPPGIIKKANNANGRFINNLIGNNTAESGGGVCIAGTSPEFVNNTIANNKITKKGSGVFCYKGSPTFINTIINDNQSGEGQVYIEGKGNPSFEYCNLISGKAGITTDTAFSGSVNEFFNVYGSAEFNNPGSSDFTLKEGSPCIDAGKDDLASELLTDLDNKKKNRKINTKIDIGAIEYIDPALLFKNADEQFYDKDKQSGDLSEIAISVYPNPSAGDFSVVIHNNIYEDILVDIYNNTGQKVFSNQYVANNWFNKTLNLYYLANGNYTMIIKSGEKILLNTTIVKK